MNVQHSSRKKQVLLVEDSTITQDILELAIGKNGHKLFITENAEFALRALEEREFDVALIDFNLPNCNGLELLQRYFDNTKSKFRPRLIALTGDASEVEQYAKSIEYFDLILAKPFIMADLVGIVESEESVSRPIHQITTLSAEQMKRPLPIFKHSHDFHVIYFPYDFYASYRNAVSQSVARKGVVDAIILDQTPNTEQAKYLSAIKGLALAAFVDRTGDLTTQVDFAAQGAEEVEARLVRFLEKRRERHQVIHSNLHLSKDLHMNLLISLGLKDCDLTPRLNLGNRHGYVYNHILPAEALCVLAQNLCDQGLLKSHHNGGLLRCPKCESARIYPQRFDDLSGMEGAALLCTDCLDSFGVKDVHREAMPQFSLTEKAKNFLRKGGHDDAE